MLQTLQKPVNEDRMGLSGAVWTGSIILPEALDGFLDDVGGLEACLVIIEESEFVLGKDVGVGLSLQSGPDFSYGPLEKVCNGRIDTTLAVPCNVEGSLDGEVAVAIYI